MQNNQQKYQNEYNTNYWWPPPKKWYTCMQHKYIAEHLIG